ncbi:hypothetical protein [Micromonospora humidisoli]|uniref:Uncharacterized protein n=1 Tax=Micromonospora humidisoli TaxID=2807622 RepID=A0ABS2JDF6_9ACTN|nr:hypothetical protein [Micromonospora humidisoli]MBM7083611.1 hypothetical protein [Micromonospora humidisoli]
MRDVVTLALDVLGLLLLAAGLGVAVGQLAGPGSGLIVAAVVVLAGRWWADRRGQPTPGRPGEQL